MLFFFFSSSYRDTAWLCYAVVIYFLLHGLRTLCCRAIFPRYKSTRAYSFTYGVQADSRRRAACRIIRFISRCTRLWIVASRLPTVTLIPSGIEQFYEGNESRVRRVFPAQQKEHNACASFVYDNNCLFSASEDRVVTCRKLRRIIFVENTRRASSIGRDW